MALVIADKAYQLISPSHRQTESARVNGTPGLHWLPALLVREGGGGLQGVRASTDERPSLASPGGWTRQTGRGARAPSCPPAARPPPSKRCRNKKPPRRGREPRGGEDQERRPGRRGGSSRLGSPPPEVAPTAAVPGPRRAGQRRPPGTQLPPGPTPRRGPRCAHRRRAGSRGPPSHAARAAAPLSPGPRGRAPPTAPRPARPEGARLPPPPSVPAPRGAPSRPGARAFVSAAATPGLRGGCAPAGPPSAGCTCRLVPCAGFARLNPAAPARAPAPSAPRPFIPGGEGAGVGTAGRGSLPLPKSEPEPFQWDFNKNEADAACGIRRGEGLSGRWALNRSVAAGLELALTPAARAASSALSSGRPHGRGLGLGRAGCPCRKRGCRPALRRPLGSGAFEHWKLRGGLALRVNEEPGAGRLGEAETAAPRGCGSQVDPAGGARPGGAETTHLRSRPRGSAASRRCSSRSPPRGSRLVWVRTSEPPGPRLAPERGDSGSTAGRRDPTPFPGRGRRGFPAQRSPAPRAPGLYLFQGLGRTDGRQPQRPEEALPCARPLCAVRRGPGRGCRGRARGAEPGWEPPGRGDRGLSSLLGLLKSSFPGESGDVRGPASRWRGRRAGEAASSYPITDCQSCRPSPLLGGGGDPSPAPARDQPGTPLEVFPGALGPAEVEQLDGGLRAPPAARTCLDSPRRLGLASLCPDSGLMSPAHTPGGSQVCTPVAGLTPSRREVLWGKVQVTLGTECQNIASLSPKAAGGPLGEHVYIHVYIIRLTRSLPPADAGASPRLHGLAPGSSAWWSAKATPGALTPPWATGQTATIGPARP
ncbi:collagen alpha-1(I) chain-like [Meriones unguiculatus]|uniref:collagen alpha-1(I) chain-like n=1 Tax=Meriones unguiculatus TaxID=10047 RepID=UPI000B4E8C1E|nr:collagen alpha-1(I) chain-like [Meriones unguiculatus]